MNITVCINVMNLSKQRLTREELIKRDKITVEQICSDDNFAYYFFHEKCRPLFKRKNEILLNISKIKN